MAQRKQLNLVADVGGTNARFALVADGDNRPLEPRSLRCDDYPDLVAAAEDYLAQVGHARPVEAAVSVASPVTGDEIGLTNHAWRFSVRETREQLGLRRLKVLNDYTALALALPTLSAADLHPVGAGRPIDAQPLAVLGPGTGLGVSGLIPAGDRWVPLAGEGGHVTYGPVDARELAIIDILRERRSHVSAESLLSGPGLSAIYAAITRLETGQPRRAKPDEVSRLARADGCPLASEALTVFCGILGTVTGNLALTLGARGGVYIGGGIVPRILDFFAASPFRERFEQHGRYRDYLRAIPTFVITAEYPAFGGAIVALNPVYADIGRVSDAQTA